MSAQTRSLVVEFADGLLGRYPLIQVTEMVNVAFFLNLTPSVLRSLLGLPAVGQVA